MTTVLVGRRAAARLVDFALGLLFFGASVATVGAAVGEAESGTGLMILAIGATFCAYLLYEVLLVALWGRTLGKQLLGLRVVRLYGGRPGLWRSLLRILLPTAVLVAFFPLYPLAFVAALIAADRRGPSDRLAGTRVVAVDR